jgi:hypothetical protein
MKKRKDPFIPPNRSGERYIQLPGGFPHIVTLVGSTRFKEQHEEAMRELTLQGYIVIPCGLHGHVEGMDMNSSVKMNLDILHLRKIDIADGVFVVNPGGYIGESTRREIAHAIGRSRPIAYLEPI